MVLLLLIFLIGGYSVSTGALTVGSLIACTQLIMYVFEPAISITQDLNIVRSTKPIRQQIDKIIERSEDGEENNKVFIDQFEKIHLENISYVYPDEEKAAVRQVSITLEAGKNMQLLVGTEVGSPRY